MKRGQQIASTGEQEEVVWLGPRRVVLGMGAVMLPLSTGDLDQLSRVVARVDADFPRLARQGLAYVHCDPFVFRLDRAACTRLTRLLEDARSQLQE